MQEGINNEGKNWWCVEFTHNQLLPSGNSDEFTYSRWIRSEKIPESTYSKFTRLACLREHIISFCPQTNVMNLLEIHQKAKTLLYIHQICLRAKADGVWSRVTPKIISHTFDFIFSLLLHYRVGRPLRNCPNFGNIFWYQHQNIINILDCFH